MTDLALILQFHVDRPVVDQTGLIGRYDLKLQWTMDEAQTPLPDAPPGIVYGHSGPDRAESWSVLKAPGGYAGDRQSDATGSKLRSASDTSRAVSANLTLLTPNPQAAVRTRTSSSTRNPRTPPGHLRRHQLLRNQRRTAHHQRNQLPKHPRLHQNPVAEHKHQPQRNQPQPGPQPRTRNPLPQAAPQTAAGTRTRSASAATPAARTPTSHSSSAADKTPTGYAQSGAG